jgi:hypothetical protein
MPILMPEKSMQAAIETKKHEDEKQQEENNPQEKDVQDTNHDVLQPSPTVTKEQAKSRTKYPLPPTEIHDGRLFRKVG